MVREELFPPDLDRLAGHEERLPMPFLLKQRFSAAAWLSAAVVMCGAAAAAQEISITARLRAGDEFRLELTRIRKNSARPQQDTRSTTSVDVRVAAVTPGGATVDWIAGAAMIDNPQVAQDPLLRAASDAVGGLTLRVRLNAEGEFAGLANDAEVASKLQAAVDIIVRDVMAKTPEDQRQGLQALLGQLLSPAALITSAARDAQIYFGLNGVSLSPAESVEARIEQPSPFGGSPLPATFTVRAESATSDSAVLTTTTTYDESALLQLTRALVEKAGRPIPPEELAKLPAIRIADDGRYVFDRTFGLMRQVVVNRRASVGPNQRFDGWEIRLAQPPRR